MEEGLTKANQAITLLNKIKTNTGELSLESGSFWPRARGQNSIMRTS